MPSRSRSPNRVTCAMSRSCDGRHPSAKRVGRLALWREAGWRARAAPANLLEGVNAALRRTISRPAISHAAPKPATNGCGRVPLRSPRSCPPPLMIGSMRTRGLRGEQRARQSSAPETRKRGCCAIAFAARVVGGDCNMSR
eukprot:6959020-Prymnesium_polylepis.2